eukprot:TRINITY_DN261_c0_g4_i2.p1 TRINITY_DN261_c0_g4~~TRINITY_DN261_c0_g4_i2.p1  ORF type:complete len:392 (-),score=6.02 TRINITY_DN261_c0_g4_i2:68-1243(-)
MKVSYFYDNDIGNFYYGQGHPMKPHRVRMTHNIMLNYRLYEHLDIFKPHRASENDISRFHSDDYVRFMKSITPESMPDHQLGLQRFNIGEDCPVFDGMYELAQISAGGSVGGAVKLNHGVSEIAINWAGGLHHAKKSEASGFCYVNDIVLAILELLKYNSRVLYIDIDIHHGDGVEEAFYTTNRVLTLSLHKFGDYFPGTGDLRDIGISKGRCYSVNIPLDDGITDDYYHYIFNPVLDYIMKWFRPSAIVLQCGADSLAGDRLGCFNLSIEGHAKCLELVKSYNLPLLLLGGGGYTVRNVARCWAFETAVAINKTLSRNLPFNDYYDYFSPDFQLHISLSNMQNMNSKQSLDKIKSKVLENLRDLEFAPSVSLQPVPVDAWSSQSENDSCD